MTIDSTIPIWIIWIVSVITFGLSLTGSIKRVQVVKPDWVGTIVQPLKKSSVDVDEPPSIPWETLRFILSLKYRELNDRRLNTYGNIALSAFVLQWIVFAWLFIDSFTKTGPGTTLL